MSKLGKQFQLVVADVVREMDPGAVVKEGQWTEGPDGRRDIDVVVEGIVEGQPRRIQIECKDYSSAGRPIGIGVVDALESKHRDLKLDASLLCSNAGFTSDAVRKAARVGIGLVGVLREDDPRIRYRVFDEIYVRRVDLVPGSCDINFDWAVAAPPPQAGLALEDITYEGLPVFDWLRHRVMLFLAANPVVNGEHRISFRFMNDTHFHVPPGSLPIKTLSLAFRIAGGWVAQRVEVDATNGLYDWAHQVVHTGAGSVSYKNVSIGIGGEPVRSPPDFDPAAYHAAPAAGMRMRILDLGNFQEPDSYPDLDPRVLEEDRDPVRSDIPGEAYCS